MPRRLPELNRMTQLGSQAESGSVLAVEGDEVSSKDYVVADEDGEPSAKLDRHRAIVRGAEAQGCHTIRRILILKLQDSEERQTVPAQRELFFPNGDVVQLEYMLQRIE